MALVIAMAIARVVYRQRSNLAARIFLVMVALIALLLARSTLWAIARLIERFALHSTLTPWSDAIYRLWPMDDAVLCLFGASWLHFFLAFPLTYPILKRRYTLVAIYAPAVALALAWIGKLILPTAWHISNAVLDPIELIYAVTVYGLGIVALVCAYRETLSLALRQQVRWLAWGIGVALTLVLLTNWLPGVLDLAKPSNTVPGLEQLPLLIILSAFAMGIVRYRGLDVDALIYRSLVYGLLAGALIALYLLLMALAAILHIIQDGRFFLVISLVMAGLAVPLRRAIMAGLNRILGRQQESYRRTLQQFSQWLSRTKTLDEVVEHITRIIEQALHPSGLALILRQGNSYVAASSNELALSVGKRYLPDCTLAGWLTAQRRPLYLPMETEWLFSLEPAERRAIEETQVSLYVPLFGNERLNGWLALGPRPALRAYSPDDLDFLMALSDQVNIALEVTRLIGELEQRVSQLSVLNETGQILGSSLRTEELLERICQQVGRLMDASNLYIALYDPETDYVSFPLALENNQRKRWAGRQAGHGLTEHIIRNKQPVLIERDMNGYAAQLGIQAIGTLANSWLGVPMIANEQVAGVIAVQNFEREEAYTEDDLDILSTIASQAAVAIANARLYERTDQALSRRVNDLSRLYQASLALAFSTETQDVLRQIGEMACEVTRSDSVTIYLYNSQTDSFTPVTELGADLPDDRGAQIRVSGMTRRALTERRSFVVADTTQEPDLNPTVRKTGIRSIVCMPLISKGQALGVMYVNSNQPNKYTEDEVQLASALASQAAIAIENGQLFKRQAEARDRLQAVLNSTREGIMMLDNHGHILFANAMFGELFNTSPASLTGRRLLDVIAEHSTPPDETLTAMMDVIYQTLNELAEQNDAVHKSDVAVAHPPRFIERVSSPVLDENGVTIGRLLALRDITEEKKAEALREDLMRMMVHDLRSPLTGILGSLQVLEMSLTNEYHMQAVRIALSSSNRLLDLINALLDISKMEEGRMPLRRQKLRWPKVAGEAVERVRALATNEGIAIHTELIPSTRAAELPAIFADESILVRVLINLLDNAIKFSPRDSTINLSVTLIENVDQIPETLCKITDAGPGIPPEYHERIFAKFFQVPDSAGKRKGSGLGLAFCRLAIEAHGGRIWVESAPGQGATFAFTLPIMLADEPPD